MEITFDTSKKQKQIINNKYRFKKKPANYKQALIGSMHLYYF